MWSTVKGRRGQTVVRAVSASSSVTFAACVDGTRTESKGVSTRAKVIASSSISGTNCIYGQENALNACLSQVVIVILYLLCQRPLRERILARTLLLSLGSVIDSQKHSHVLMMTYERDIYGMKASSGHAN